MARTRRLRFVVGLLILCGVSGVLGWGVVESVIQRTSGVEFCAGCHSMQPMAAAYQEDVHGGANPDGIRVPCADCHLPHESSFGYLVAKIQLGAHDLWVELTRDTDRIDWLAMRAHRERFVHDSGCLSCHSDLERATSANPRAFVAHKPYFLGQTEKLCVSCHQSVGHAELERHLKVTRTKGEAS